MEEIQLKDICDLDNGYAFKSDDYVDNSNTLNCRMSNIRPDGSFDILYSAKYLPDEFAEKYKDYILHDGDLIIAMTDMVGILQQAWRYPVFNLRENRKAEDSCKTCVCQKP